MKIFGFSIFLVLFSILNSFGQDTIFLKNPSFEGVPAASVHPKNWVACGQKGETGVDIQPGSFGVETEAAHGKTYLSMVVRDNNTWENIQQKLPIALKKDSSYSFSIALARSDVLMSYSRMKLTNGKSKDAAEKKTEVELQGGGKVYLPTTGSTLCPTGEKVNFHLPVILQIWGGREKLKLEELLAKSPLVDHTDWKEYRFQLQPIEADYQFLFLQAFFNDSLPAYNGNILIDNCSPIIQIKPTTNN